jgi:hypothetical protein
MNFKTLMISLVSFAASTLHVDAQNIIQNGNLETRVADATNGIPTTHGQVYKATGWTIPPTTSACTYGNQLNTPDLFDRLDYSPSGCNSAQSNAGVPNNWMASNIEVNPLFGGDRYIGLYEKETVSATLAQALQADNYVLQFYSRPSPCKNITNANICIRLTDGTNFVSVGNISLSDSRDGSVWTLHTLCLDFSNVPDIQLYNNVILQYTETLNQFTTSGYTFFDNFTLAKANAGTDKTINCGGATQIGTNPTGIWGATYSWSPSTGLSNTSISNPTASPTTTTTYTLTVNAGGCVMTDIVVVNVNTNVTPVPTFTVSSPICAGNPIIVNGSATTDETGYMWKVQPCSSGGVVFGTEVQGTWVNSPGAQVGSLDLTVNTPNVFPGYTFQANQYYKITLGVASPCSGWVQYSQIIFVNPKPVANAGADVTICQGTCTTIGTPAATGTTYQWSIASTGKTITLPTTAQVQVCPTVTTTYNLVATNSAGCTSSDQVIVSMSTAPTYINPNFTISFTSTVPSGNNQPYTISCAPSTPMPANSHFQWYIQEIDQWGNNIGSSVGPNWPAWQSTTSFPGYTFLTCHWYRISRGTWSDCVGWAQSNQVLDTCVIGTRMGMNIGQAVETFSISVYPNPASDQLFVEVQTDAAGASQFDLYNVLGEKVRSIRITDERSSIDLAGLSPGMYYYKVSQGGTIRKASSLVIVK